MILLFLFFFLINTNSQSVGLSCTGWALSRTDGYSEWFCGTQLQDLQNISAFLGSQVPLLPPLLCSDMDKGSVPRVLSE